MTHASTATAPDIHLITIQLLSTETLLGVLFNGQQLVGLRIKSSRGLKPSAGAISKKLCCLVSRSRPSKTAKGGAASV
jgi:hypothetical protein